MNVLVYADAWGSGGIEAHFVNVARYLKNSDVKLSVVTMYKLPEMLFEKPLRELGVPFTYRQEGIKPRITFRERVRFLLSEIEHQKPDIVHLNISDGFSFYLGHKIKQRFPGVKVIHHAHGNKIGGRLVPVKRPLFGMWQWLYEREADYRIACSKQVLDWMYISKNTYGGGGQVV